jgi:hypothetical protein
MDLVSAIVISYTSTFGVFIAVSAYVKIKKYIIEKYYD